MLMMNTVVLACLMMVIYGDCRWKMSPDNLPTCLTWDINSCPVAPVSRHDFRPHPGRRSDTRSDGKKISASYRTLRWFLPYWITWFTYVYLVCSGQPSHDSRWNLFRSKCQSQRRGCVSLPSCFMRGRTAKNILFGFNLHHVWCLRNLVSC